MNPKIQIIAILGSVGIMLLVFLLIRRGKLREEYSFLWFGASIGLIGLSFWRDSLEVLADWIGVDYPPSVLLLGGIIVGLFLAIHYSISLSSLADQNKRLAQELALLRHYLDHTSRQLEELAGTSRHTADDASTKVPGGAVLQS